MPRELSVPLTKALPGSTAPLPSALLPGKCCNPELQAGFLAAKRRPLLRSPSLGCGEASLQVRVAVLPGDSYDSGALGCLLVATGCAA